MSDRFKRILFIVFFLLFSMGVAAVIYFAFFRQILPSPGPGSQPPGSATGTLPGSGPFQPGGSTIPDGSGELPVSPTVPGASTAPGADQAQTLILHDGVTQQVSASADGQSARYYNPDDGKFYRVTSDGVSVALSAQTFPDVDAVTWGNSSDQAILGFPDGTKLHYDFRTQKQTTLPKHWDDFNFSPDDKQVVAKSLALNPGSRYLIVTDPTGNNPRAIEPLGENADKTFPVWTPNNQIIAYAEVGSPQGLDRQEIILVGQNHENFRGLQVEGRGFMPLWSPNGSKLIYSVWSSATEYRPELWISGGNPDTVNKDRTKLDLQTWANKCTWGSEDTLYCAVPDSLPSGAGLQPALFTGLEDSFYHIDLRSGTKTYLGKPEGAVGVSNLVVTGNGRSIMFTDGQTGRLYEFLIP